MYPIQMKLKKNDKVVSVYNISVGVNGTTSIATYYDGENWYTTNVTKLYPIDPSETSRNKAAKRIRILHAEYVTSDDETVSTMRGAIDHEYEIMNNEGESI